MVCDTGEAVVWSATVGSVVSGTGMFVGGLVFTLEAAAWGLAVGAVVEGMVVVFSCVMGDEVLVRSLVSGGILTRKISNPVSLV